MKKLICIILSALFLVLLSSCGKESPVEDFEYEMEDGEVIITGYIGSDLEIYIPSKINDRPVTAIGEEAFEGYDMTYVSMPDSVVIIEKEAFRNCACLKEIDFSKKLTEIGENAFMGCEALTKVDLPEKLETIRKSAFSFCPSLSSVKLPESLLMMEKDAFEEGENLGEIKIPDNTDIEVEVKERYMTSKWITSPVGGKVIDYISHSSELGEFNTALIVSENSKAYEKLSKINYSEFGLTVKVKN